ncbi:MAG TPA: hypothetical protein VF988_04605 [Verrucomicrobiae bacterium]
MDSRYRRKAVTGLTIWAIAVVLAITTVVLSFSHHFPAGPRRDILLILWAFFTVIHYVAFFWGATKLARAKGHSNGLVGLGIFPPAQLIILPLILFGLPDKCAHRAGVAPKHHHSHHHRQARSRHRLRRRALLVGGVGMVGIMLALVFALGPGLFEQNKNARMTAILIFFPSYAAIIYSSWCWARAKRWPGAIVVISLLPLLVMATPEAQELHEKAPALLPAGVVIMPLTVLAVVAVLPDRSRKNKGMTMDMQGRIYLEN